MTDHAKVQKLYAVVERRLDEHSYCLKDLTLYTSADAAHEKWHPILKEQKSLSEMGYMVLEVNISADAPVYIKEISSYGFLSQAVFS